MHWTDMDGRYPVRQIGRAAFEQGAEEHQNPYNESDPDEVYSFRNWRTGYRLAERDE